MDGTDIVTTTMAVTGITTDGGTMIIGGTTTGAGTDTGTTTGGAAMTIMIGAGGETGAAGADSKNP
ncbi:hypothetical protein C772_01240 [Bhargavaea cecembensis DSE10]|uniref:Uncharacterized protein n=1 Tax=Bhargavaea cecembensis DSE10 TaxID=1235279 RepID=M7NHJ8_9BACL|nr:hypothetical protein [Bhargavaea cecembensis]EMR06712.1 hypothetical protein C772_01240 [Bhargavaea cecembensis DSE10]